MVFYYFHHDIHDIIQYTRNVSRHVDIDFSYLVNPDDFDLLIYYGFLPSSIEYCMKYDDIEGFNTILSNPKLLNEKKAKWSPFEWGKKPSSLDFLSFSGIFGSIKCFKNLLMNNYIVNDSVLANVACSGNHDLFYQCHQANQINIFHAIKASQFCRLLLLKHFIENEIGRAHV